MARITNIERRENTRNRIHDEVECTYSIFYIGSQKYFQMDTYGTKLREVKGQPSQKIQFDKECAEKLVRILMNEFNL